MLMSTKTLMLKQFYFSFVAVVKTP